QSRPSFIKLDGKPSARRAIAAVVMLQTCPLHTILKLHVWPEPGDVDTKFFRIRTDLHSTVNLTRAAREFI
ncbi:hypothetical protein RRG08_059106, partial [Elysia crispata]